jgi:hypothetical protein
MTASEGRQDDGFLGDGLELLEEVAGRAGDVDAAGDAALAILDALDDARGLFALGAGGALEFCFFLTIAGLCSHGVSPETRMWLVRQRWNAVRPGSICGLAWGWAEQEGARRAGGKLKG